MTIKLGEKKQHGLNVIAKATNSCNLACKYCYVNEQSDKQLMDKTTLENLINKTSELHDNVNIIWHGGEPLIQPITFYEKAIGLQKRTNTKFRNSVQTNGTRLTDDYIKLFKEHGFQVGFSIDGPQNTHDLTRTYKTGKSSFSETFEAIMKAREQGIGGTGAIVVLNKLNIDKIDEIYDFAVSEKLNLQLNPLIKAGKACGNILELGLGPSEYGEALSEIFPRWFSDNSGIKINPLHDMLKAIITGQPQRCTHTNCQNRYISVSPRGNIYPCGRFDGNQEFYLGNINEDKLSDTLNSDLRISLQNRTKTLHSCNDCRYKTICNSGCMHNAYSHDSIQSKDYYCASYKILFKLIEDSASKEILKAEYKTEENKNGKRNNPV